VEAVTWTGTAPGAGAAVAVQFSAHGTPVAARWQPDGADAGTVVLEAPARRVAPGQSVVLYDGGRVLGGGTAG
jgi:tRNA-specific 2-thiouridylase